MVSIKKIEVLRDLLVEDVMQVHEQIHRLHITITLHERNESTPLTTPHSCTTPHRYNIPCILRTGVTYICMFAEQSPTLL